MDFVYGLRYLFNNVDDPQSLEDMQKQIAKKSRIIKCLKEEIGVIDFTILFYKLENFKLERLLSGIKERREYNEVLYSALKTISGQTDFMSFYLDRIELEKIRKYDKIPLVEHNKHGQQQIEIYQNMADEMEKRDIVLQFRAVQEKQQKLFEMRDKLNEVQLQKRKHLNLKLDIAIEKRKTAIVEIITKAKRVAELRLQLQNRNLNNKVQVQSSIVLTNPGQKATAQIVKDTQQPPLSEEHIFKVPKIPPLRTEKTKDVLASNSSTSNINEANRSENKVTKQPLINSEFEAPKKAKMIHETPNTTELDNDMNLEALVQAALMPNLSTYQASKDFSKQLYINVDAAAIAENSNNLNMQISEPTAFDLNSDAVLQTTSNATTFNELNRQPQVNVGFPTTAESLNCKNSMHISEAKSSVAHDIDMEKPLDATCIESPLTNDTAEHSLSTKPKPSISNVAAASMASCNDSGNNSETSSKKSANDPFQLKSWFGISGFNFGSDSSRKDDVIKPFGNNTNDFSPLNFESEPAGERNSNDDFLDDFNSTQYHSKLVDEDFL